MKVAEEFVKELLGDWYYYTIAVHTDKPHLHAHITFDSVSGLDGKNFIPRKVIGAIGSSRSQTGCAKNTNFPH